MRSRACHKNWAPATPRWSERYLIEGHVPASDVRALLQQKPQAPGLTVPGMPVGSPGMDGAVYGNRRGPYDVLLVELSGSTRVFSSYNKAKASP